MMATAGTPSATVIVAVCEFMFAARSAVLPAAEYFTNPVSFPPMVAASVTTATASFAVDPVETEAPEALAPEVVKPEKTKSDPARLASDIASEKVSSTVVLVFVCADRMAGPALSDAAAVSDPTSIAVTASFMAALVDKVTLGVAPVSEEPPSTKSRLRLVTPEEA